MALTSVTLKSPKTAFACSMLEGAAETVPQFPWPRVSVSRIAALDGELTPLFK